MILQFPLQRRRRAGKEQRPASARYIRTVLAHDAIAACRAEFSAIARSATVLARSAALLARGRTKKPGLRFDETASPPHTACPSSLRRPWSLILVPDLIPDTSGKHRRKRRAAP
jgi:hypothetical protein